MISLGMNTIYTISDELCQTILEKINRIKDRPELHESHFLERLRYLFIRHCDSNIIDNEFARLKNDKAIVYYKIIVDTIFSSKIGANSHFVTVFALGVPQSKAVRNIYSAIRVTS